MVVPDLEQMSNNVKYRASRTSNDVMYMYMYVIRNESDELKRFTYMYTNCGPCIHAMVH